MLLFYIQVKYIHPNSMVFVIFLLDIIYGALLAIIALIPTSRQTAIATIVTMCVLGAIVILPSIFVLIFLEKSVIAVIAWIIQLLLAGIYLYGKYITGIMQRYGSELGCDESCQRTNQFIAMFCIVLTILLFSYIIPELYGIIKKASTTKHHTFWYYFFGVIVIFVHANAIYSTISIIHIRIPCTVHTLILSLVLLIVISVIGWFSIWRSEDLWTDYDVDTANSSDFEKKFFYVTYVALALILPFYLLCNNRLPLGYVDCHLTNSSRNAASENGSEMDDVSQADHIVRLIGMIATALVVLFVLLSFWKYSK